MKRFILLLCIFLLLMQTNIGSEYVALDVFDEMESLSPSERLVSDMSEEIAAPPLLGIPDEAAHEADKYDLLMRQFFNDANVPEQVREKFAEAIYGDAALQAWIDDYRRKHDDLDWSVKNAVFPYSDNRRHYSEMETTFNIGVFYYRGSEYIGFAQDKAKTFEWLNLSAEKGNYYGALWAGDMALSGDGIPVDEIAAFSLYSLSASIEPNATASVRLGDSHANGIGTASDSGKAFRHYLDSALMGDASALHKLAAYTWAADIDLTALHKSASSQNYSGYYFAMVYDGLDGYAADDEKHDLIAKLSDIWDGGSDAPSSNMQRAVRANRHFSAGFVETLIRTIYD